MVNSNPYFPDIDKTTSYNVFFDKEAKSLRIAFTGKTTAPIFSIGTIDYKILQPKEKRSWSQKRLVKNLTKKGSWQEITIDDKQVLVNVSSVTRKTVKKSEIHNKDELIKAFIQSKSGMLSHLDKLGKNTETNKSLVATNVQPVTNEQAVVTNDVNSKPVADAVEMKAQNIFNPQKKHKKLLSESSRKQYLEKYNSLKSKSPLKSEIYVIPERRNCGVNGGESQQTISRAKKDTFITEEEIVTKHPMMFLPNSPFIKEDCPRMKKTLENLQKESHWISLLESAETQAKAIAITKSGKHIILQQAIKTCVPTCVGMLVLDHGKTPNYDAIKNASLATSEQAMGWFEEAGFNSRKKDLPEQNICEFLSECITEHGSGILSITHPVIRGHVIILDEISIEKNEAVVRDPFHGRMLTIKLDILKTWLRKEYFIQITSVKPSSFTDNSID